MNTILQSVNPSDLVHDSNVRGSFPSPAHHVSGRDRAMDELIESVRMFGVMQPITVRRQAGKLHIVYGHRRAYAAAVAALPVVPVLVQNVPDEEIVARQLIENMHRADLTLAEQAAGARTLFEQTGVTSLVAAMIAKSSSYVSKLLTLTAPGKSSLAQTLLRADAEGDVEKLYLLCTLEALNYDQAHRAFHNWPAMTRALLKQAITAAKQPEAERGDDEDDEDDEGDTATASPAKTDVLTISLTLADCTYLASLMVGASIPEPVFATMQRIRSAAAF